MHSMKFTVEEITPTFRHNRNKRTPLKCYKKMLRSNESVLMILRVHWYTIRYSALVLNMLKFGIFGENAILYSIDSLQAFANALQFTQNRTELIAIEKAWTQPLSLSLSLSGSLSHISHLSHAENIYAKMHISSANYKTCVKQNDIV